MSARPRAINLQFGKGTPLLPRCNPAVAAGVVQPTAGPQVNKSFQIIPSSRGSHSEISGT
jgi:hypothetical protein